MRDILIDWLYLLTSTFVICVILYFVHLTIELFTRQQSTENSRTLFSILVSWVNACTHIIEQYFWTSLALLCLFASAFYHYMRVKADPWGQDRALFYGDSYNATDLHNGYYCRRSGHIYDNRSF